MNSTLLGSRDIQSLLTTDTVIFAFDDVWPLSKSELLELKRKLINEVQLVNTVITLQKLNQSFDDTHDETSDHLNDDNIY